MFHGNAVSWASIGIGIAWKVTLVFMGAWLATFLLRQRSAAMRHLVWVAATAVVLVLPLLLVGLPELRVIPLPAFSISEGQVFRTTAQEGHPEITSVSSHSPSSTMDKPRLPAGLPERMNWLMLFWSVGTTLSFAQMALASFALRRIRSCSIPSADQELCRGLSQQLGIPGIVELQETEAGSMPMTFGLLRSTILMPADAAEWTEERRRLVLLHELAHVRRRDAATHLVARVMLGFYWWHPLAWFQWRQIQKERERAADDLVLNLGTTASTYASHLLEVAQSFGSSLVISGAALAMARRSQLEERLQAILDTGICRNSPGRVMTWAVGLLVLGMAVPFAAVRAQESTKGETSSAKADALIHQASVQKNTQALENAAESAEQRYDYSTAQKLWEAALAIQADTSGLQSVAYGRTLLRLANLRGQQHQSEAAEADYAKAAQLLGERKEAVPALLHLGIAALRRKEYAQAVVHFQHAESLDAAQAGPSLMWRAVARQQEGQLGEAETFYQSALSVEDPASAATATTLQLYAGLLRQQGRSSEADSMEARATSIQKAYRTAKGIAPPSAGIYRVSQGIQPPSVLLKVDPEYSDEARAAKLSGTVLVSVEIGIDGLAHQSQILQGLGLGLDENALEGLSRWRFRPGTKDGQPVPVSATIEIHWKLW